MEGRFSLSMVGCNSLLKFYKILINISFSSQDHKSHRIFGICSCAIKVLDKSVFVHFI